MDSWLPAWMAWGISHPRVSDHLAARLVMGYTRSPGEGDSAEKFSSHVDLITRK